MTLRIAASPDEPCLYHCRFDLPTGTSSTRKDNYWVFMLQYSIHLADPDGDFNLEEQHRVSCWYGKGTIRAIRHSPDAQFVQAVGHRHQNSVSSIVNNSWFARSWRRRQTRDPQCGLTVDHTHNVAGTSKRASVIGWKPFHCLAWFCLSLSLNAPGQPT